MTKAAVASLLIVLSLNSCASPRGVATIPAIVDPRGFDFTPFTSRGFLFTPEPPAGDYESVGLVTVTVYPGAQRAENVRTTTGNQGREVSLYSYGDWTVQALTATDALEAMYTQANGMGANAVVNLRVDPVERTYDTGRLGTLIVSGFRVHGFAVRQ